MTDKAVSDALAASIIQRYAILGDEHLMTNELALARTVQSLEAERDALKQRAERAEALCDRLKLEAQGHAQEARTLNAIIAEIYQLCTGATGEPGNWNGAEPVRALTARLAAAEADARRYRLLRDNDDVPVWVSDMNEWGRSFPLTGPALDTALDEFDAAIAQETKNG